MDDLKNIMNNESGQGLVEYSLIISLIATLAIGAILLFGDSVYDLYEGIKEDVINAL